MKDPKYSDSIILRDVTLKFPHWLFNLDTDYGNKYKANILFPVGHPQAEDLKQQIQELFQRNYPGKKKWMSPLLDGNQKDDPEYRDKYYMVLKADANHPPFIADEKAKPTTEQEGKIKNNCKVNAKFYLEAYEVSGSYGVTARLEGVQYCGEPDNTPMPRPANSNMFEAIQLDEDVEQQTRDINNQDEPQLEEDAEGW